MSSDQLVVSILSYLSGPFKNAASDAESVDVAIQCLTDAAGLDDAKKASLAVPHSLPAIFEAGLAALNNPTPSTTSSTTPTDPKYTQFLELLASRGFFGSATPGSAEYNEKLELAKKKFVAKYGSGGEESKSESKTAPSPSQPAAAYTPPPVTDAQKARAEEFKAQGNAHLQAQRYDAAVESYTQAITQNPTNAIYWANRAAAYQHLKQYEKAVTDCREAIRVDPLYAKGHYRLGAALFQLDRTQDAINAYEKALSLSTNDPNMAANIREQLDVARAKLTPPNPFGGGPGGLDFASLMNNPAIANIMSSMGGGGGSGGGLDIAALMSNPAIQQMAQQFMGGMGGMGRGAASASSQASSSTTSSSSSSSSSSSNSSSGGGGGNDFLNNLMSNPEILALRDDPTLAPVFADVQANGESALYKYLGDPNVMSKLSGIMGKLFGGNK